jgi:hypothetical protein
VRVLLIGNAPPWAAFALWVIVASTAAVLTRAIILQADRERHDKQRRDRQRRDQLDNLDDRLRAVEDYLFLPEDDDTWPNMPR